MCACDCYKHENHFNLFSGLYEDANKKVLEHTHTHTFFFVFCFCLNIIHKFLRDYIPLFLALVWSSTSVLHVAQELFTHLIGVELCVNFFVTPLFAVGDIDGTNINCSGNDEGVLMTADDDEFGVTGG